MEYVARDWLARVHQAKVTSGHAERTGIRLEQDVFPWLGKRPLREIEAPEPLACLRKVEAREAIETAHRINLLRPGELRHMEWRWIDFKTATLKVSAETMKRKKAEKASGPPHIVPLAPQAVAILLDLKQLTGDGRYVFPALTTSERCMSENTVRSALRRLGYGNDDMTAPGLRAMARTMVAERLGIEAEVIEAH